MAIVLIIYTVEARTLAKVSTQIDVVQGLQVLQARIVEDAQASSILAFGADPGIGCVAMVSARDDHGNIVQDAQNQLVWQRYRVYYYKPSEHAVWLRDIPLLVPTTAPVPLTEYDDGGGIFPLAHYATGGSLSAEKVSQFKPSVSGGLLNLSAQSQQLRAGSDTPETVSLQTVVHPRN